MTDHYPRRGARTVRADVRNRVSLGKEHAPTGKIFLFEVTDDGVITLTPAVAVPLGTLGFNDPTAD